MVVTVLAEHDQRQHPDRVSVLYLDNAVQETSEHAIDLPTDLTTGVWTDVTPVVVNENGPLADDMTVTVSKSNAVNGKLFLRLKASMP